MTDPVLTVAHMRAAERAAMDSGASEWELMQRAGEGAAQWVARMAAGRAVTVLCGPGNNGGDGYVIAQSLRRSGYDVSVVAPEEPGTETARIARRAFEGEVCGSLRGPGPVVVDALFGYGLSRPVEGAFAELLASLTASSCFKIAIDLPSSVESDSGAVLGPLADYDLTLALGGWKQAHFLMPAMARMGIRRLVPIGLDTAIGSARLSARPVLEEPAADAHKYRRGLLAIVAGAMPGATLLAAEAAMRSGAGYVKMLSGHVHPGTPAELVVDRGDLGEALADERISALLVGPGLGRDENARDRLVRTLETAVPCVLDADALLLLDDDLLEGCDSTRLIVTPHEGELSKLCNTFGIYAATKLDRARGLHDVTGLTVLAKGPDTILAGQAGLRVFDRGSSWLSVAGTGDVLAGIVAARLAVHGEAGRACEEGVWLHHHAARLAAPGFSAGELARVLGRAMKCFL